MSEISGEYIESLSIQDFYDVIWYEIGIHYIDHIEITNIVNRKYIIKDMHTGKTISIEFDYSNLCYLLDDELYFEYDTDLSIPTQTIGELLNRGTLTKSANSA